MSPRVYTSPRRQEAAGETRTRIFEAARRLLHGTSGAERFSIEAVAREAGVVRATVYYQFGSRAGLIEAFFDYLADRAELPRLMGAAIHRPRADEALRGLVEAFAALWASDRDAIRSVRAMATLDPELNILLSTRNERRRFASAAIIDRLVAEGSSLAVPRELAIDLLWTLSNFEAFDALAGARLDPEATAAALADLAIRGIIARD